MSDMQNISGKLNQHQLDILKLFARPLQDKEYRDIKSIIRQYLIERLDDKIEKWEDENNITPETYKDWGKDHKRTSSGQ